MFIFLKLIIILWRLFWLERWWLLIIKIKSNWFRSGFVLEIGINLKTEELVKGHLTYFFFRLLLDWGFLLGLHGEGGVLFLFVLLFIFVLLFVFIEIVIFGELILIGFYFKILVVFYILSCWCWTCWVVLGKRGFLVVLGGLFCTLWTIFCGVFLFKRL